MLTYYQLKDFGDFLPGLEGAIQIERPGPVTVCEERSRLVCPYHRFL